MKESNIKTIFIIPCILAISWCVTNFPQTEWHKEQTSHISQFLWVKILARPSGSAKVAAKVWAISGKGLTGEEAKFTHVILGWDDNCKYRRQGCWELSWKLPPTHTPLKHTVSLWVLQGHEGWRWDPGKIRKQEKGGKESRKVFREK